MENEAHGSEKRHEYRTHMKSRLCITCRKRCVTGTDSVSHLDLRTKAGNGSKPLCQPKVHAGGTHGGHGIRRNAANPNHVDHVVRHLHQRGSHNGKRQPRQCRRDASVQQINFLHPIFLSHSYNSHTKHHRLNTSALPNAAVEKP